jgi:hypothetical protein
MSNARDSKMAVSLAKKRRLEKLEAKRCADLKVGTSERRGEKSKGKQVPGQKDVKATSRDAMNRRVLNSSGGKDKKGKEVGKEMEGGSVVEVHHGNGGAGGSEEKGDVYDKAVAKRLCPWLEESIDMTTTHGNNSKKSDDQLGGSNRLGDVFHELLSTNPRYRLSTVSSIVDKMKEKTLLLDNPDSKRDSRSKGRYLKHSGVAKLSRKELADVGALNVPSMGLTYDDALVLHTLWKEYRDGLLEDTRSKGDMEERVYGMDRHGAYIVVEERGVQGIVVADSQASMHIIDTNDKYRILPKKGLEYQMEVSKGTLVTILAQKKQ